MITCLYTWKHVGYMNIQQYNSFRLSLSNIFVLEITSVFYYQFRCTVSLYFVSVFLTVGRISCLSISWKVWVSVRWGKFPSMSCFTLPCPFSLCCVAHFLLCTCMKRKFFLLKFILFQLPEQKNKSFSETHHVGFFSLAAIHPKKKNVAVSSACFQKIWSKQLC